MCQRDSRGYMHKFLNFDHVNLCTLAVVTPQIFEQYWLTLHNQIFVYFKRNYAGNRRCAMFLQNLQLIPQAQSNFLFQASGTAVLILCIEKLNCELYSTCASATSA